MKTVWVIEQGEYSDYRVVGVFSSEANARLVCDKINAGDSWSKATIAEWALDPVVEHLNAGRWPFNVLMLKDGSVERITKNDEIGFYDLEGSINVWKRSEALAHRGKGIPDVLSARVWATDEQHAIKITNEHRAQLIALGKF